MNDKKTITNKEDLVNVGEFIDLLKDLRQFLKKINTNSDTIFILSIFIKVLRPYRKLKLAEIESTLNKEFGKTLFETIEKTEKVKNISFVQLQNPVLRNSLSREELAIVAERELGISKWRLIKLSRKEMEVEIETAFENFRTLKTIAKSAARAP